MRAVDSSAAERPTLRWLLAGVLSIHAADYALAAVPTSSLLFTVGETLALPVWAVMLLRRMRATQGSGLGRWLMVLAALVVGVISAKHLVLFQAWHLGDLRPFLSAYRTYTVLSAILFSIGLAIQPRWLGRFVARMADHQARLMLLSFGITMLVGALLLTLPLSLRALERAAFIDALFDATGALAGALAVSDVAATYSRTGQLILVVLMQLGGLGIMVLYAFFAVAAGRKLAVRQSFVMVEMLDAQSLGNLRRLLVWIVGFTLITESIGAAALYVAFLGHPDIADPLWAAVFHAVSAFCNAGFTNLPLGLSALASSWSVQSIFIVLMLVGALGFPVIEELWLRLRDRLAGRRPRRLTLHTRVALATTVVLMGGGAVVVAALEWQGAFRHLRWDERALAGLFHAASSRAGFQTVDPRSMGPAALLTIAALMFIGGAPGSTTSGIKTTTLAVLFATFRAQLRGEPRPQLFGRAIAPGTERRALVVAFLGAAALGAFCFAMFFLAGGLPPHQLAFDVVSAVGGSGMSTGVPALLQPAGKLVLALAMFVGRIGPLTLAVALAESPRKARLAYPEEHVGIG